MTYRIIDTGIWSDPWFEDLDQGEKLLFIYLFTNENCNQAGITRQGTKRIAYHIGATKEKVDEMIAKMQAGGKIIRQGDMVACGSFIKHQARNGNFIASVKKAVEALEEGNMKEALTREYTKREATPKQPESKEEATPKQPETEVLPLSLKEREREIEIETEKEESQKTKYTPDFEKFWAEYPRKEGKSAAYKCWKARIKEGGAPEGMILAARKYAFVCKQQNTEEQFRKMPRTFLNHDWIEWRDRVMNKPQPDYLNGLAY